MRCLSTPHISGGLTHVLCILAPPPSDRERTADSKSYNAYIKAQLLLPAPSSIVPSSSNLLAIQTSNEVEYKSEAQSVQPITGDLNFAYPTVDKRNDPSSLDEEWDNLWWKKKQNEKGLSSAEFEWEIWQKWEELTFLRQVPVYFASA